MKSLDNLIDQESDHTLPVTTWQKQPEFCPDSRESMVQTESDISAIDEENFYDDGGGKNECSTNAVLDMTSSSQYHATQALPIEAQAASTVRPIFIDEGEPPGSSTQALSSDQRQSAICDESSKDAKSRRNSMALDERIQPSQSDFACQKEPVDLSKPKPFHESQILSSFNKPSNVTAPPNVSQSSDPANLTLDQPLSDNFIGNELVIPFPELNAESLEGLLDSSDGKIVVLSVSTDGNGLCTPVKEDESSVEGNVKVSTAVKAGQSEKDAQSHVERLSMASPPDLEEYSHNIDQASEKERNLSDKENSSICQTAESLLIKETLDNLESDENINVDDIVDYLDHENSVLPSGNNEISKIRPSPFKRKRTLSYRNRQDKSREMLNSPEEERSRDNKNVKIRPTPNRQTRSSLIHKECKTEGQPEHEEDMRTERKKLEKTEAIHFSHSRHEKCPSPPINVGNSRRSLRLSRKREENCAKDEQSEKQIVLSERKSKRGIQKAELQVEQMMPSKFEENVSNDLKKKLEKVKKGVRERVVCSINF